MFQEWLEGRLVDDNDEMVVNDGMQIEMEKNDGKIDITKNDI